MGNGSELGNVTIKVKKGSQPDTKVYKCPYVSCPFYSLKYEDVQSHKVLKHGDIPAFFKTDNATTKRFSRERMSKINLSNTKYKVNKLFMGLKIYMKHIESSKPKKDDNKVPIKV